MESDALRIRRRVVGTALLRSAYTLSWRNILTYDIACSRSPTDSGVEVSIWHDAASICHDTCACFSMDFACAGFAVRIVRIWNATLEW